MHGRSRWLLTPLLAAQLGCGSESKSEGTAAGNSGAGAQTTIGGAGGRRGSGGSAGASGTSTTGGTAAARGGAYRASDTFLLGEPFSFEPAADHLLGLGDPVRGGEAVARVGNSGAAAESGLYFELRRDGKPFDPMRWVAQ